MLVANTTIGSFQSVYVPTINSLETFFIACTLMLKSPATAVADYRFDLQQIRGFLYILGGGNNTQIH